MLDPQLSRDLAGTIAEVRPRVEAALKTEGFGVLTEIDVAATLKAKIGAEFRPYVILGACNPHLAHRALSAVPEIGLMLPCNVVLDQIDPHTVRVAIFDPIAGMALAGKGAELDAVAGEARERLSRVAAALG